jgi:DNA-binding transcriptional ArsR family regulator
MDIVFNNKNFSAEDMDANAERVARFLKSIANRVRLRVLCALMDGEKSAGELSREIGISQPNLSQHLSWLKNEDLVSTRRDGTTIHYRLTDTQIQPLMQALHDMFCRADD